MSLLPASAMKADASADVIVIGAGACGLTAALRAAEGGAEVIVLERDERPAGSTSMSSGFVPAAATHFQQNAGIPGDNPERFAADIMKKTKGRAEPDLVATVTAAIGPALEWLADAHGFEWIVLDDFLYPGHSVHRMHAVPEKTGAALMARLLAAAGESGVMVATGARVTGLFVDGRTVHGVQIARPDGSEEHLAGGAVVLACSGYGGNRDLVARHIPEMADAAYYGHEGNRGDALLWGEALGADVRHLSGYQGHGSLASPHQILISWALMMEGAIQVNAYGRRFSNESGGYSEQAVNVLAQPKGTAWNIYDERIHAFAQGFPDYRDAIQVGAVRQAADIAELARLTGVPEAGLRATIEETARYAAGKSECPFGRDFRTKPALREPFFAVKVTGALFHTQGGLMVGGDARVLSTDGAAFANLFAGGGAACGVSGPDVSGYLSGNGLLIAIALGYLAGRAAADKRG